MIAERVWDEMFVFTNHSNAQAMALYAGIGGGEPSAGRRGDVRLLQLIQLVGGVQGPHGQLGICRVDQDADLDLGG